MIQDTQAYVTKGAKGGVQSKVDRYSWVPLDTRGELRWIEKGELLIDTETYQRVSSSAKVRAIASKWSWMACGVILVARREDGSLYAFDGGHRLGGAMLRSDIEMLPCIIFEVSDLSSEARAFLASNTYRKPMSSIDQFDAKLIAEDGLAQEAKKLIDDAGRTVGGGSSGTTFRSVASLLRCLTDDPAALRTVWPVIVKVSVGRPIHQKLLEGLFYIERNIDGGESLATRRWSTRILEVGYDALLEGAHKASAYYAKGGARVYAEGILNVLNKRMQNKLTCKGVE